MKLLLVLSLFGMITFVSSNICLTAYQQFAADEVIKHLGETQPGHSYKALNVYNRCSERILYWRSLEVEKKTIQKYKTQYDVRLRNDDYQTVTCTITVFTDKKDPSYMRKSPRPIVCWNGKYQLI